VVPPPSASYFFSLCGADPPPTDAAPLRIRDPAELPQPVSGDSAWIRSDTPVFGVFLVGLFSLSSAFGFHASVILLYTTFLVFVSSSSSFTFIGSVTHSLIFFPTSAVTQQIFVQHPVSYDHALCVKDPI